jgi:SAM-dependent methyltransferase
MFEISDSEINVDRVMHEIREDVARQHRSEGQKVSASLSGISLTVRSDSPGDSSPLSLQPEFHSRRDDQYHINDFLKYHGGDFVRNAYRALLKREPDPSGWTRYLESLASGRFNKVDILASLRYSPEGEQAKVKVAGLAWPATIRRLERLPIIGYLLRMVIAVGRLPRLLQHLRQSEFYLLAQRQQIVDHDNQVHKQLAEALAQVSAGTEKQQQVIESLSQQQIEFRNTVETRLTDLDQHTAALAQQVQEQTERLLGRNQELTQELQKIEGQIQQIANEKDRLLARQHELTQEVAEQKDRFLRGQHELSLQMADQLRRQQLTHTELLMQERRLTSFLDIVREHSSGPLDQPIRQTMMTEKDHLLDPLYASFEDQFRGDREEIKERLRVYLPIVREAEVVADVLDIGCGRGEWLEILKDEGVRARGIDHNRVFVEQCRQSGLEIVEEDALAYLRSLPGQSLNAVTSFHLVEHLPFEILINLLDEIVRTLRPGGLVILETPNPENFMVGSCNFYADPTHRNPIPSPTLRFLLESRGLGRVKVVKLRPWDAAKIDGDSEIIKRFNEYFYSAPDYGIIGWKV